MKWLTFLLVVLFSCADKYELPTVELETTAGEIIMEVYPDKAPATSAAFLENVKKKLYDDGSFYRVLRAEDHPATSFNPGLIQGGIHLSGKPKPAFIPHEPTSVSGLSHTNGVISMARTDTGTASSEFFICIDDQSPLDHGRRGTADSLGMAAFGKVIKGMDVVKRIQSGDLNGDQLAHPVKIISARVL